MAEYIKEKRLGQGAYGTVYHARHEISGESVAIKRMYTPVTGHSGILALRELQMSVTLSHPHIVTATRVLHESPFRATSPRRGYRTDKVYLVYEKADADLDRVIEERYNDIRQKRSPRVTLNDMKQAMLQLATGLHYLHGLGIVHRDLKPNNVLCYHLPPSGDGCRHRCPHHYHPAEKKQEEQQFLVRITDMGEAKSLNANDRNSTNVVYMEYRAPELLYDRDDYDVRVDVWSLGCMYFEMLKGKSPFPSMRRPSLRQQMHRVFETLGTPDDDTLTYLGTEESGDTYPVVPLRDLLQLPSRDVEEFDSSPGSYEVFLSLLSGMLVIDPRKRLDTKSILSHPFFVMMAPDREIVSPSLPIPIPRVHDSKYRRQIIHHLSLVELEPRHRCHALDLVNRITHDKEIAEQFSPKIVVAVVTMIVVKFWMIDLAPTTRKIVPYRVPGRVTDMDTLELRIIRDLLHYEIYRPTIYDYLPVGNYNEDLLHAVCESACIDGIPVDVIARVIGEEGNK